MNSLIITGGMFDESFACDFYNSRQFDYVIGVDRGIEYARQIGVKPDYIIGDFDSFQGELDASIPVERYPSQKDLTDTHLAILKAIELGSDEIIMLCGCGGRLDHFMANVSMLALCCEHGVHGCMVDPWNRIHMISSELTIEKDNQYGTYVSLVAFTDRVKGITVKGFKYPLQDGELTNLVSLGISNELVAEKGTIAISEGLLLVIESKDVIE